MRYNYPISSQQLKDQIDQVYEMQLYILGYSTASGHLITGVYDIIEASGISIYASGYPDFEDMNIDIGRLNYINLKTMENNNPL